MTVNHLGDIVGGDWWQAVLSREELFEEEVRALVQGFCNRLRHRFKHVCHQEVLARAGDRVPKYAMVFGSRSPQALLLMNDAMASAREMFAKETEMSQETFWELRAESVAPNPQRLTELVLAHTQRPTQRAHVFEQVARARPGSWFKKEIRAEVERLLKAGQLRSATGGARINDKTEIWQP